ncbi:hypothetical protein EXIGLDRAFT_841354 [Exidia glandulosa HHB12029]|uniref:Uncharacterized protein n=1 Tax=Exidia glandulosa HHB12029 TaxID=1314781 RepID=A0A165DX12_EXIGL|nr:hypothetical protein EXIGLDRAFT_841354 [Exidia glandulosa HHB12029]
MLVSTLFLLLLAGPSLVLADHCPVENTLHKRAGPTKASKGTCATGAQQCLSGDCCAEGSFCLATNSKRTTFICATDRSLSSSSPPISADACPSGAETCQSGGCCASGTTCTPADDSSSSFVCMPPTWPDGVPAGTSTATAPDSNGSCSDGAALCSKGAGCCKSGTTCLSKNAARTSFVCSSDRVIPGAPQPSPDLAGSCPPDASHCSTGGCCPSGTACQPTDQKQSSWVCAAASYSGKSFGTPPDSKPTGAARRRTAGGSFALISLLSFLI